MAGRTFTFIGGVAGAWQIVRAEAVTGEPLPQAPRLEVVNSPVIAHPPGARWLLRGGTSNECYVTRGERREIFETRSEHIRTVLRYLPAVARRLHHSRDLGQPFDFLTWFEYAPETSAAFEELVARLSASEEWKYVEREVDICLVRDAAGNADEFSFTRPHA